MAEEQSVRSGCPFQESCFGLDGRMAITQRPTRRSLEWFRGKREMAWSRVVAMGGEEEER